MTALVDGKRQDLPTPIEVTGTLDVEIPPLEFPPEISVEITDPGPLALETTLAAMSAKLPSALASDRLKVDGSGVTQPVSIAAVVDVTPTVPAAGDYLPIRLTDGSAFYVAGGGTEYDEDTASTAADKLTMAGVVRKDTAATLVDTDGDRTQLQVDAVGRLYVNGSGVTQPVSGAITETPVYVVAMAPAVVTAIGTTSTAAVASNSDRRGLHLQNTSTGTQILSLGFGGATAVAGSGVVLYPGDHWTMTREELTSGAVAVVSSASSGILSVQEYEAA